jgi:hypothetical protein
MRDGWEEWGMSDFNAVILILAITLADVFIYLYLDRSFERKAEIIVTGFVGGVRVPTEHRWMLLSRTVPLIGIQIFLHGLAAFGMWLLAHYVSADEVATLAYLACFFALTAAVGWTALAPFNYVQLTRLLRQAETD